jgi:hypothetical protein
LGKVFELAPRSTKVQWLACCSVMWF